MPILYLYDHCSQKTIFVNNPGAEPYYSGFAPRGGVRQEQVDFTSRHDVCRKCRHRETSNCVRLKLRRRSLNSVPTPGKRDGGLVVIELPGRNKN